MYARRNEHESYQTLISILSHYTNLQIMLQNGIQERCRQLTLEHNIIFPQFFTYFYINNNSD
jgi:hypothetical protein